MAGKIQTFFSNLFVTKYDIFISYRRKGGYAGARAIQEMLKDKGYRVFLDVEGLRTGEFNKQLYQVIDQCKDVLIICSPNSLDRCKNEGDWMRSEISYAIAQKKSIIPILFDDFQFPSPDELPEEMRSLPNYQALVPSPQTFSESINTLTKKYLKSRSAYYDYLKYAAVVAVLLGLLVCSVRMFWKPVPDENMLPSAVTDVIDQNCAFALGAIQQRADACLLGLQSCEQYLDGELDERQLKDFIGHHQKQIESDNFPADLPALEESYDGIDFYEDLLAQAQESTVYSGYLDFADWLVLESNKNPSACKMVLENMEQIVRQDYLDALNRVFGAFLPIQNRFERKPSGDYRYSTIYLVYHLDKNASDVAGTVQASLFANSNDSIRVEQIHERINGSTAPFVKKIENMVGPKWQELTQKEK